MANAACDPGCGTGVYWATGSCVGDVCQCSPGWCGAACNQQGAICDQLANAGSGCHEQCGTGIYHATGNCVSGTCECVWGWSGEYCHVADVGAVPWEQAPAEASQGDPPTGEKNGVPVDKAGVTNEVAGTRAFDKGETTFDDAFYASQLDRTGTDVGDGVGVFDYEYSDIVAHESVHHLVKQHAHRRMQNGGTLSWGARGADVFQISYNDLSGGWSQMNQFKVVVAEALKHWVNSIRIHRTVKVSITLQVLGSGVLGSTGAVTWALPYNPESVNGGTYNGAGSKKNVFTQAHIRQFFNCWMVEYITSYGLDDIDMYINTNFDWYLGTDGNAPSNQYDLMSTLIHEFGHGFGFTSTATCSGAWCLYGTYSGTCHASLYDEALRDNQGALTAVPGCQWSLDLLPRYTSNQFKFVTSDGSSYGIYSPSSWRAGSSLSHLDQTFEGTDSAGMTYSSSRGEVNQQIGTAWDKVLKTMGYKDTVLFPERFAAFELCELGTQCPPGYEVEPTCPYIQYTKNVEYCGCVSTAPPPAPAPAPGPVDNCPNDPNKTEPGTCGCGVADNDTDLDGVLDCNDVCPSDNRHTTDKGVCNECGADDSDSDNDGTPNCQDNCPNDSNKVNAGACGCGRADVDTDNDGVMDCNDQCPNDPLKTAPGTCGCGYADNVLSPSEADYLWYLDVDGDGFGGANYAPHRGCHAPMASFVRDNSDCADYVGEETINPSIQEILNNGIDDDCNPLTNDVCSPVRDFPSCGNGVCETGKGEHCGNCPADCLSAFDRVSNERFCCGFGTNCGDPRCTKAGEVSCDATAGAVAVGCCGDQVCSGNENAVNCPGDCVVGSGAQTVSDSDQTAIIAVVVVVGVAGLAGMGFMTYRRKKQVDREGGYRVNSGETPPTTVNDVSDVENAPDLAELSD
eukprot:GFYU01000033.1.p1 GENE.GFYU01000033.1~~GFYU01000033.1.p1  ORF type:complete len:980 (-),score=308.31 GFYU01000033.1:121-2841(-)